MILDLSVRANCQYIVTYNTRDFSGINQFGIRVTSPEFWLNLQSMRDLTNNIQNLKDIFKVRNEIAHELDIDLTQRNRSRFGDWQRQNRLIAVSL